MLIANVTPIAFNAMGQRYFFVFACLNAAMAPAIYYLFPETSGRSLEEMDEIFASSSGVLDVVACARRRLPPRYLENLQAIKRLDEKLGGSVDLV